MMGRLETQESMFYRFRIEDHVPQNHLLTFVSDQNMISERPAEADDRAVPGSFAARQCICKANVTGGEGDLILGLQSSATGTLVDRSTRFTLLLHLSPMPGHRTGPRKKNGPALAGHGAAAVRDAITKSIQTLSKHLRKSLTWDQGAEMARHGKLKTDTGIQLFFCDPQSPLSADCCAIACRAMHGSAAAMRTPTG